MKTDRNSFEPYMGIPKIVYMCGVLLCLMFLTRSASGQTVNTSITLNPGLALPSPTRQQAKVRRIYISQTGVREKQINSGPEVEKYLRYVNLPKGNPWCAAFVCWVYGQAGVENPRSGWSPALFGESRVIWSSGEQGTKSKGQRFPPNAQTGVPGIKYQVSGFLTIKPYGSSSSSADGISAANRCAYPVSLAAGNRQPATPRPADIFGLYFPEKGRIAHVGFIDDWQDPWVTTVEGNTSVLGSREGDGVYRKRRLIRSVYKVARYAN